MSLVQKKDKTEWIPFVGEVTDGNGGRVYTGTLVAPVCVVTLQSTLMADSGIFYKKDREMIVRLLGHSKILLAAFQDAVERLDRATDKATTKRPWLDDYYQLISAITDGDSNETPEYEMMRENP